ncbi:unnamed protein product [Caenorhabditis bovis]|uniref:Uncharacterized protein n=1 Tax=Caenorhabditis bovis TaxID=2654633 RepID=A0A8S1EZV3_9PELO|nr:unnamed protein product [Caenorhabditis bovis]
MGNREPTEAEKIREALENFDAPRFRPPEEARLLKNYSAQFSPLETPPPIAEGSPMMAASSSSPIRGDMEFPPNLQSFADVDDSMPANLAGNDGGELRDLDRFKMDLPSEIYPDDPMPRMIQTPPMNSLKFNLGENIANDIDNGLMAGRPAADNSKFDVDDVTRDLGNIRFENQQNTIRDSHLSSSDDYNSREICAQCRAEDDYMDRLRRKADEERRKYEEMMRRAKIYDHEMHEKEAAFKKEEAERNAALREHIDRVNAELIELKRNRTKSPPQENYIFRHESPRARLDETRRRQDAYRAELDRQVEEKRVRRIAEFETAEALDAMSNARAALEFANAREAERKSAEHAKELARKQLEFQNWLWWAERPDEHGWRDARMRSMTHTNQVERNVIIKESIGKLEDFKSRQSHDDQAMRDLRRAKYDRIREQLHENSKMMYPLTKTESRPIIVQPDPRVEAAWREAHEKYDKKFRVLQENPMRSISGTALDGPTTSTHATTSCRRCARCARPLERKSTFTVHRGETILPNTFNN